MTVQEKSETKTLPSLDELYAENIRLRRTLKVMLPEIRKQQGPFKAKDIHELRSLLKTAHERLSRGENLHCNQDVESQIVLEFAYSYSNSGVIDEKMNRFPGSVEIIRHLRNLIKHYSNREK